MAKAVDKINAGVVVATRFVVPEADTFQSYIEYIDRDTATRSEHYSEYSAYQDYMDNPEKTTELFTADKDTLSAEEKQKLKQAFQVAQKNGSLMWQTVISFDNAFLEKNGIYNSETQTVDENKMRELTRGCMENMLKHENFFDTALWSAAIHFNTDNIHIHIATTEPVPTREKIKYKDEEQYRGKFKYESIAAGKRYVVNDILQQQPENQLINDIIRGTFVKNIKTRELDKDKALSKLFLNIYRKLPNDKRMWYYNMNSIKDIRPLIDKLSKTYIETYHKEDFEKLQKYLDKQQDKYMEAYGTGKENKNPEQRIPNNYAGNKINDMYARMGNAILSELRAYDKENRAAYYKYLRNHKGTLGKRSPANYRQFNPNNSISLRSSLKKLRRSLQDEYEKKKNLILYEEMEESIRQENERE